MPITDYEGIRQRALTAVTNYLGGDRIIPNLDGLYHGEKGRKRAEKLRNYLNSRVCQNNPAAILACLLAVFGEKGEGEFLFFNWSPGRSSRLAGLIADQLITEEEDTITSNFFSDDSLQEIDNSQNWKLLPSESDIHIFDTRKGVRILLQKELEENFSDANIKILREKIKKIRGDLDNDKIDIRLEHLPSVKVKFKEPQANQILNPQI